MDDELKELLTAINNNIVMLTYSNMAIAEELNKLRHEETQGNGADWTLQEVMCDWYGVDDRSIEPQIL